MTTHANRVEKLPLSLLQALGFALSAVVCFHVAYAPGTFGPLRLFIVGYLICLVQLARIKTTRQSFYAGLAVGFLCAAPQLACFWVLFGASAIALWLIVAFWIAAFVALTHVSLVRLGALRAALLIPFIWTGLEYFRSELYYLKFSWLNVGYAFAPQQSLPLIREIGMYGVGFLLAAMISLLMNVPRRKAAITAISLLFVIVNLYLLQSLGPFSRPPARVATWLPLAGIQMEFPVEDEIISNLNKLVEKLPEAQLLVLSEYTLLDGPPTENIKAWCREHQRYLMIGGKDPAPNSNFYDTAFVIDPNGEIVFRQAKAVPVQFLKDGLAATEQKLWESPWGKIGVCICYDLSYTRVTDRLIELGAQAIICPTMDVIEWGEREHKLHARVAPIRAAEYGVPLFRVASSGVSQFVERNGRVMASAPFPGQGAMIWGVLQLSDKGSLPFDRILAPICVAVTGILIIGLTVVSLKRRFLKESET